MLLHAQQVMPPNNYICDILLVRTLVLKGKSLYLLDDPRMFSMLQYMVVPSVNPANQAPGVQLCPASGIKSFYMETYNGKKNFKQFFLWNHESLSLYI